MRTVTYLHWRITIPSAKAEVWARLVDFESMHTWFVGVRRMSLLAAEPGPGAERLLRLITGTTHRERITRWEPPERLSIVVLDSPVVGRDWAADIRLCEDGVGTELRWELRYEPRFGVAGRIVNRLLVQPVLDIVFRVSLRRLRVRVEQEAQHGHH
jgi:uncharacterized protein YndB with AHSA1/START domain